MWFGTWDGLDIYNGYNFKVFKPEPGDRSSISNNIIRDILEQRSGIEWIATDNGINRMDLWNGKFERFFSDSRLLGITSEKSFLIAKDTKDRIFASIYGKGLFIFDETERKFFAIPNTENILTSKVFFDTEDDMWVLTNTGRVCRMKINADRPQKTEISLSDSLFDNVRSIFYNAKKNVLWLQSGKGEYFSYDIRLGKVRYLKYPVNETGFANCIAFDDSLQLIGTNKGLFSYDPGKEKKTSILTNIQVLSVLNGTQHIIWVGTDMQGVWQLSPKKRKFISFPPDNSDIFGNCAIRSFYEDPSGRLWIGTKGNGIYIFGKRKDKTHCPDVPEKRITTANGLLNNSVYCITADRKEIWIGTDGHGLNYYDPVKKEVSALDLKAGRDKKVNLSSVYSILPWGNDTLWVGTSGYGMYRLVINKSTSPYSVRSYKQYIYAKGRESISNNIVYSIIKDDDEHLWIGTRGGGLNHFDIRKGTFESEPVNQKDDRSLAGGDILCLYKDSGSKLWAGTSTGLYRIDGYINGFPAFRHFTEKDGMPNNTIHGILEDNQRNIWVSTNKGIAKIIPDHGNFKIISYYMADGLKNNEFSDGAYYKDPSSELFYFGSTDGFSCFNPRDIQNSTYMPNLLFDSFYVDNEKTDMFAMLEKKRNGESVLILSPRSKSFSFSFAPIDYLYGRKCDISYYLEGYQKTWINIGTSNTIVLSNIRPGKYRLNVRCSNPDKEWSDKIFTLPITIRHPWYSSIWAYLGYFMIIFLTIWEVIRQLKYRISARREIRQKEMEKEKMEDIHEAKLMFFTNIAHEFSNSLTLIYGPCEQLLQNRNIDPGTKKYLNVIESNTDRMQSLIQELIEFRKAETGHLKLDMEPVDIVELAKCEADYYLEILEQKHIELKMNFNPEKIIWCTDRDCLEKIIFNLISNAVKYTPENNEISISISETGGSLEINIANTGVGIGEQFREQIFDRYEVLNRFENEMAKGLRTSNGIGLALCKNLVELINGTIRVESDGSTYTAFIISLNSGECKGISEPDSKDTVISLSPGKAEEDNPEGNDAGETRYGNKEKEGLVLIIDDDNEIRTFLKDVLSNRFEVKEASNGKEALESIGQKAPDLIICDVIMPVMGGVEFVRIMKKDEITRHIPIILLSAKSTIENQIEGLETGADAYLGKPFNPRHLTAIAESLLKRDKALLEYSKSAYSAVAQFEGKIVSKEDNNLITAITEIIYNNLDSDKLSIDMIANEIVMSKMKLYRKIKEILDMTPTEYIRLIRLQQAEKLLSTTNKTVQEIMFECGFSSKTYFYKIFSTKYHLTPKEYRASRFTDSNNGDDACEDKK
jgi:signal transduction histidine kinase/DNA-binding response OmpR family regulator/sugar lactone lactonase YvrE